MAEPMVPPAPPRFSTTIGWPSWLDTGSRTMRPTMSSELPAENGIIARMGLAGQLCARASVGSAGVASADPARCRNRRRVVISFLPEALSLGGSVARIPPLLQRRLLTSLHSSGGRPQSAMLPRQRGRPASPGMRRSEKPVRGPRQAEILAQRLAFVLAPKQAAPLQFRHHAADEIVEPAGQVRKHHREAVGAFGGEPFLHLIGD